MNSRLELFNKQLERCGLDAQLNGVPCKVLVKDIDDKGFIETKHIYVPLEVMVSVGDTIAINNNKYMVLNINRNNCYSDVVVQEIYHSIKVKYSWLDLMQFDVMVSVNSQALIDTSYLVSEKTTIEVQLQRNELSKQIKKGTRFFIFDVPYEVTSITYENSNILSLKCDIDSISPSDDMTNQIADNSQLTPPTPKYTITSSAGVNGTITPLGEVVVEQGKPQIFTITPNEGYEIDTVLVDDVTDVVTDYKYTFSNVQADHTISVSFKETQAVAPSLSIVETNGETELYKGYANEYSLKDGVTTVSPVTWSVDKSWITLTQDGTKCTIKFNSLSYINETVVLTALYNGFTYTVSIRTQS